jgi:hypothetical protein
MARPEWREGPIESSNAPLLRSCVFAVIWNALTWSAVYGIGSRAGNLDGFVDGVRADPTSAFLLFFPLLFVIIAIVSALRALRLIAGALRFGRAHFSMQAMPAAIGGDLRGVIRAPGLRVREGHDILLTLTCRATQWRRKASGSGRSVSEAVKWKTDRVVSPAEINDVGGEAHVPVKFSIPPSAHESEETIKNGDSTDIYSWWLVARTEPHSAWSAEFPVPVFRTAASATASEEAGAEAQASLAGALQLADLRKMSLKAIVEAGEKLESQERASEGAPATRPPSSRIVVHPRGANGVLIEYPAATLFLVTAALWLSTLPLYVVLPLDLLNLRWFGPIKSLVGVFVVNGIIGYFFVYYWPRRLLIGREQITLYCGLPFFGARLRMPAADAGEVKPSEQRLSITRKSATGIFDRWFFAAPPLASDAEARWLAAEIERALAARAG